MHKYHKTFLEALTAILQDNPHVTAFVELKEESKTLWPRILAIGDGNPDAVAKQTVVELTIN